MLRRVTQRRFISKCRLSWQQNGATFEEFRLFKTRVAPGVFENRNRVVGQIKTNNKFPSGIVLDLRQHPRTEPKYMTVHALPGTSQIHKTISHNPTKLPVVSEKLLQILQKRLQFDRDAILSRIFVASVTVPRRQLPIGQLSGRHRIAQIYRFRSRTKIVQTILDPIIVLRKFVAVGQDDFSSVTVDDPSNREIRILVTLHHLFAAVQRIGDVSAALQTRTENVQNDERRIRTESRQRFVDFRQLGTFQKRRRSVASGIIRNYFFYIHGVVR